MTQEQLRKLQVIDRYRSKAITREKAAELLGLSERQITRLKKGVEIESAGFVINKNTGRTPAHAIPAETPDGLIELSDLRQTPHSVDKSARVLGFRRNLNIELRLTVPCYC